MWPAILERVAVADDVAVVAEELSVECRQDKAEHTTKNHDACGH